MGRKPLTGNNVGIGNIRVHISFKDKLDVIRLENPKLRSLRSEDYYAWAIDKFVEYYKSTILPAQLKKEEEEKNGRNI